MCIRDRHDTVTDSLFSLSSNDDNYKNLREAFAGGAIDFKGKTYTLNDLAQQRFPDGTDVNDTEAFRICLLYTSRCV